MPSKIIDQRVESASSHFLEEVCFPVERQIGVWKQNTVSDHQKRVVLISGSKLVPSSPMEKFSPIGIPSIDWLELRQWTLARGQMKRLGIGVEEGTASLYETSRNSVNHHPKSWSNLFVQPACYSLSGNGTVKLSGNDILSYQPFNTVASHHGGEEPFESLEEIEAHIVGNLLPDEDDLFSGVIDDLGHNFHGNTGDDLEDFDLFSSGGGMELEGSDGLYAGQKNSDIVGVVSNQGGSGGSIVGEHPYGEQPSRTLFVRNINSNVEDSELKALFEQYGDIRTIYTACKHHGFVMISYYDIRAACNAMRALQNKPLRQRKLDIHYSIPKDNPSEKDTNQGTLVVFNLDSSVLTDDLRQIFSVYGEIREIRETPQKCNHKFIEFYDIRAAEAAQRALNGSDIGGKLIKLKASCPGGRFMQQAEQEQDEPNLSVSLFDDLSSGQMVVSSRVITSSCMDNGSFQVLHSSIRSPVSAFSESHQSSSVPNNLPSPARAASIGKQFGLHEPNLSLAKMKFGNQHPSFHPHSLPEYHDSLTNGLSYNSPSAIADMASNVSSKIREGVDNRHIRGVSSNGHLMEPSGGIFGSPGNGSYSLRGNPYALNNSNSHQQHPSSPMVWPNSPSLHNGLHANHITHMPGFPRVTPLMLNTASPVHHHIGSAPAVNHSIWDRQRTFPGESPQTSDFHLGSLGSVGLPGRSPSHPMGIASGYIFSHVGGNCMELTQNVGLRSPHQMCHLFPGRNPMMSMQTSFDSSNEHARILSYRRNESNSNHADKKQYELDIDRILRGEDSRTTLMIKNIPNKYTSKMLLAAIDEHCRGTYDFIYLPIDFKNKCNVGYAFINMIDPLQIIPFYQAFNGKKWEKFNSEKVASIAYARIQGKAALIAHFQNSSLMNEDKRCRPILFHTDGPNAGDPEPFPMGTNIRSRFGKPRSSGKDDSHRQGNSSNSANGEDSPNGSDSSGSPKDSD